MLSRVAADEAEILTIAVEPAARASGLATALLSHHLSRLARAGAGGVFLEVDETNLPALALYRRFGFRQVGRRSRCQRHPTPMLRNRQGRVSPRA